MSIRSFLVSYSQGLLLNSLIASRLVPRPARSSLLSACGMSVRGSVIGPRGQYVGTKIRVGRRSFLNEGVYLDSTAQITIGRDCQLGMQAMVLTGSHKIGPATRRAGGITAREVHIGDGCWIGARAVLLPGVTIGEGCVVAAGAVVTRNCAPGGLYAGVPARRVRDL